MEGAGRAKGVVKALTGRVPRRALVVGAAAAVSAASLGGISYALASSSTSTPYQVQSTTSGGTPTGTQPSVTKVAGGKRAKRLRAFMRRSVHASFVVKDKAGQYVTVDADRGTVTSSSSSSITVLRPDGVSVTDTIGPRTRQPKTGLPARGTDVILVSHDGSAVRIFDLHRRAAASSSSGATSSS